MSMAIQSQFNSYDSQSFYDEMFEQDLTVRAHYEAVHRTFARMKPPEIAARHLTMQQRMLEEGITFTLYSPNQSEPLGTDDPL